MRCVEARPVADDSYLPTPFTIEPDHNHTEAAFHVKGTLALASLTYEPNPLFRPTPLLDDSALADCKGERIGILIVTYNAPARILKGLDSYFQADLVRDAFREVPTRLGPRKFDKTLLLDAIEHLADPGRIVSDYLLLLHHRGQLIISVPNVGNIGVGLMLMLGQFRYAERGILDRTHLRFFTGRTIRELLEEADCSILHHEMTVIPLEQLTSLWFKNPVIRRTQSFLTLLTRMMPGLFGYQSFIVARPRRPWFYLPSLRSGTAVRNDTHCFQRQAGT
jgi:hypothetical protein